MEPIWDELYRAALAALKPRQVSRFIEAGGKIYTGVCVDSACTLGVCAERNAIFHMITEGENAIRRVIAVGQDGNAIPPCGACRELMSQLMPEDYKGVEVMLDYENNRIVTLGQLTPEWWI